MLGTIINAAAVIAGGSLGLLFNTKLPERFIKIVFQGIGIFTLFIGFYLALKTNNLILMISSIVIGSVLGELLRIDKHLDKFAQFINSRVKSKNSRFTEGFTTSFLLFCIGSMTILGAIEEGLGNKPHLLLIKSLMDGISSIALASAMGIGVIFSVIPLFLYQGGLTLFAKYLDNNLNDIMIDELTAIGGLLLIGLGITILDIKKINTINMIPSLIIIVILVKIFVG